MGSSIERGFPPACRRGVTPTCGRRTKALKTAAAAQQAADILEQDHDEVLALLKRLKEADNGREERTLAQDSFREIEVHAKLEQELALSATDERYDAKLKVLEEAVRHRAEEQGKETFPKVKRLLGEAGTELGAIIAMDDDPQARAPAARAPHARP